MEKGLETIVEGVKNLFVVDTSVLMLNYLSPKVLANAWDSIEDDPFGRQIIETARRQRKLKDHPNHVIIYDLVIKELDGLLHDSRQKHLQGLAGRARTVLSDIQSLGLVNTSEHVNYVEMENGSRIYFVEHDEGAFLEAARFDPNIDDRLVWNFGEVLAHNLRREHGVQLVTQDKILTIKARNRAASKLAGEPDQVKKTLDSVREFEFETVDDQHQAYTGSKMIELDSQEFAAFISGRDNLREEVARPKPLRLVHVKPNQFIDARSPGNAREHRILKMEGNGLYARKLTHYDSFMRETAKVPANRMMQSKEDIQVPAEIEWKDVEELWKAQRDLEDTYLIGLKKKAHKTKDDPERAYREVAWSLYVHNKERSMKGSVFHLPFNQNLKPKKEQQYALELLCDTDITVASLVGPPGTGKTLWALYAGLVQVAQGKYKELVYFRPPIGLNEGHGFVKGGLRQKLEIWVKPALDSLLEIFGGYGGTMGHRKAAQAEVERIEKEGLLVFEADTHQQGATWRDRYVVGDETQLLTRDQMRTMVNRVGEGSKLVLVGDPEQVGATAQVTHYFLTESNNGLVHLVSRLQGQQLYGHITFIEDATIMRSRTARELGKLL